MNNVNIASFKTNIKDLFTYWLTFTYPLHNLSATEIRALSALLLKRYVLSEAITNEKYINKLLFSPETKVELAEVLGINIARIHNLYSQLRKKNIILDGRLNPKFIPNISQNAKSFKIIFNFDIND
jgi:hypothetical protein